MLPRFLAGVFFANHGDGGNLYDATENVCRNVGTAWMITEVFTENLFTTVLGLNARLYGYKRNGKCPSRPVALFL